MRTKFKDNIVTALDIGSSKIVCLIAEIKDSNNLKILGIGHHISQGFKGTVITDIKLAESSIISAIYEAEKMAGLSITKILVSIDGSAIEDEDLTMETVIDEQVTAKNLKDLLSKTMNSFNSKNREILHFFPLDFGLDGTFGIKDPVSMYGYSLQVKAKIIYLPASHIVNLVHCLEKSRLNVVNVIVSGYAAAFSCLSKEEKEQGVTLIDIGANTTSIITFYQNNIVAYAHLAIGGNHITSDISYGLALDLGTAEKLKIMKGNAFLTSFDNGSVIEVESDNEDRREYIPTSELSMIIRARIEEILEMTKNKMEELNIYGLASKKIVLTGGTSNLTGIKEIASNAFKSSVKIAIPSSIEGIGELSFRTDFAAAIGALKFMAANYDKPLKGKSPIFKIPHNNYFNKAIKWLKENL
jgi:cell division protein FtsA